MPEYTYYNRNPKKAKLPDCVCRAISLATDSPYYIIWGLLEKNGLDHGCDDISLSCYSKLLDGIGYKRYDACDLSVAEVAKKHPYDRLIVRIEGHLTCCIKGVCYDIWDCTQEKADVYWIVK